MHGLETKLKEILGARSANALDKAFGMQTVDDLLRHFPRRYANRGELTDLRDLRVDEHVTVMADIASVTRRPMKSKRGSLLEVVVTDGAGSLKLTFFNQDWRQQQLTVGRRGLFSGKVTVFNRSRQLAHPTYVLVPSDTEPDAEAVAAFARPLIPVYPATASVQSWAIERAVALTLEGLDPLVKDALPAEVAAERGYPDASTGFHLVHQPASEADYQLGRERFAFEEALVYQSVLAGRRLELEGARARPRPVRTDGLLAKFDAALPFRLTDGQQRVSEELFADLAQEHPMHRLLQGEVGSGKTVCALRAMLAVVDAGGQAALLAPTEVLAQQHYRSITALLGELAVSGGIFSGDGTTVRLLTGSMSAADRKQSLLDAASGSAGILVGTHALIQDRVQFADLGLVVVDEQHRFGVEQRAALAAKAAADTRPHVLVMTATPIPRTVAMTVFGDLDVSILRELPAGRSPISTHLVPAAEKPAFLERAWARVREEVAKGHQAYVVCSKISATTAEDDAEGEEGLDRVPANVEDLIVQLAAGSLFGLRLGMLHGRLPAAEKDAVMRQFAAGELDVLVATTVVEVGVDVPNASVMVIVDADRFGVSQLHQLRGRVGRGAVPGLCLLVTYADPETPARDRLAAVAATLDGFELSEVDLAQRREGDVLGVNQSGRRSSLRVLNVLQHADLIAEARKMAFDLVSADPTLSGHPELQRRLRQILEQDRTDYLEKA